jgi:hypothetical protein
MGYRLVEHWHCGGANFGLDHNILECSALFL